MEISIFFKKNANLDDLVIIFENQDLLRIIANVIKYSDYISKTIQKA